MFYNLKVFCKVCCNCKFRTAETQRTAESQTVSTFRIHWSHKIKLPRELKTSESFNTPWLRRMPVCCFHGNGQWRLPSWLVMSSIGDELLGTDRIGEQRRCSQFDSSLNAQELISFRCASTGMMTKNLALSWAASPTWRAFIVPGLTWRKADSRTLKWADFSSSSAVDVSRSEPRTVTQTRERRFMDPVEGKILGRWAFRYTGRFLLLSFWVYLSLTPFPFQAIYRETKKA